MSSDPGDFEDRYPNLQNGQITSPSHWDGVDSRRARYHELADRAPRDIDFVVRLFSIRDSPFPESKRRIGVVDQHGRWAA